MSHQPHNSYDSTTIEVLHFAIPEVNTSSPMGEAATGFSEGMGADFTSLDVWTNPDAVLAHRVRLGPAIIVLADGVEVGRLEGPRSRRCVDRFFSKFAAVVEPVLSAA